MAIISASASCFLSLYGRSKPVNLANLLFLCCLCCISSLSLSLSLPAMHPCSLSCLAVVAGDAHLKLLIKIMTGVPVSPFKERCSQTKTHKSNPIKGLNLWWSRGAQIEASCMETDLIWQSELPYYSFQKWWYESGEIVEFPAGKEISNGEMTKLEPP